MLKVIRTANVVNFAAYNDIPLPVSHQTKDQFNGILHTAVNNPNWLEPHADEK